MVAAWVIVILVSVAAAVLMIRGLVAFTWLPLLLGLWVFMAGITAGLLAGEGANQKLSPRTFYDTATETVTATATVTQTLPSSTVVETAPPGTVTREVVTPAPPPSIATMTTQVVTVSPVQNGQAAPGTETASAGNTCQFLDGNNDVQTGTQDGQGNCLPTR